MAKPMKNLLLFFFLIFIFSCKDKTVSSGLEACGVKDPVRNLPWLKAMIEKAKADKQANMLTITVGRIGGEVVFDYYLSYMSCIGCIVYHCDGSRLDPKRYTVAELTELSRSIRGEGMERQVIWPEK